MQNFYSIEIMFTNVWFQNVIIEYQYSNTTLNDVSIKRLVFLIDPKLKN